MSGVLKPEPFDVKAYLAGGQAPAEPFDVASFLAPLEARKETAAAAFTPIADNYGTGLLPGAYANLSPNQPPPVTPDVAPADVAGLQSALQRSGPRSFPAFLGHQLGANVIAPSIGMLAGAPNWTMAQAAAAPTRLLAFGQAMAEPSIGTGGRMPSPSIPFTPATAPTNPDWLNTLARGKAIDEAVMQRTAGVRPYGIPGTSLNEIQGGLERVFGRPESENEQLLSTGAGLLGGALLGGWADRQGMKALTGLADVGPQAARAINAEGDRTPPAEPPAPPWARAYASQTPTIADRLAFLRQNEPKSGGTEPRVPEGFPTVLGGTARQMDLADRARERATAADIKMYRQRPPEPPPEQAAPPGEPPPEEPPARPAGGPPEPKLLPPGPPVAAEKPFDVGAFLEKEQPPAPEPTRPAEPPKSPEPVAPAAPASPAQQELRDILQEREQRKAEWALHESDPERISWPKWSGASTYLGPIAVHAEAARHGDAESWVALRNHFNQTEQGVMDRVTVDSPQPEVKHAAHFLGGLRREREAIQKQYQKAAAERGLPPIADTQTLEQYRSDLRAHGLSDQVPGVAYGAPLEPMRRPDIHPRWGGKHDEITLPDGSKHLATYQIIDASQLQPSHNPVTFEPNPAYPEGVQGRRYHADRVAQENVAGAAATLDPDRLLRDTGNAQGSPIITQNGTVVAGNQRAMMLQRAIALHPEKYAEYRQMLEARADQFDVDPEVLNDLPHPVLVRSVHAIRKGGKSLDLREPATLKYFNDLSDTPEQKARSARDEGAARASRLSQATGAMGYFNETAEPTHTLRSYLDSEHGRKFLDHLVADGVVSRAEMPGLLDKKGRLNDSGKNLLEQTFYSAALGNADLLDRAPPNILRKLDSSLPALVQLAQNESFSIREDLGQAVSLLGDVANNPNIKSLNDLLGQRSLLGDDPGAASAAMLAKFLDTQNKATVTEALQRYAKLAEEARAQSESGDIFGAQPATKEQLFHQTFTTPEGPIKSALKKRKGLLGDERGAIGISRELTGGFYSRLERAIQSSKLERAPAQTWISKIRGVGHSAEEFDWALRDLRDQPLKQWTKADLLAMARKHGYGSFDESVASVKERQGYEARMAQYHAEQEQSFRRLTETQGQLSEVMQTWGMMRDYGRMVGRLQSEEPVEAVVHGVLLGQHIPRQLMAAAQNFRAAVDANNLAAVRVNEFVDTSPTTPRAPQYAGYTEPGGTNYREIVIRAPDTVGLGSKPEFHSGHWPDTNPLLHIRLNDRIGANGEKVLHAEEIQSDWHEKGRSYGYKTGGEDKAYERAHQKMQDAYALMRETIHAEGKRLGYSPYDESWVAPYGKFTEAVPAVAAAEKEWRDAQKEYYAAEQSASMRVPDAPLKNTPDWMGLGMKRVIDEAVAGGYDRISWTPGDLQAARYDMSQAADKITYEPEEGALRVYKDGQTILARSAGRAELVDLLGKDGADRLMRSPKTPGTPGTGKEIHTLEGDNLKVGGHGMRAFYDQMLPGWLKSYSKKMGVEVTIEPTETVDPDAFGPYDPRPTFPSFKVSPELADKVRREGQPIGTGAVPILTSITGAGAGAAAGGAQDKKHPIRGAIAGALAGLGAGAMLGSYSEGRDLFGNEPAPKDLFGDETAGARPESRAPQGMTAALDRAKVTVADPKEQFLAKQGKPSVAYTEAKALLARNEKIGGEELKGRLPDLRGGKANPAALTALAGAGVGAAAGASQNKKHPILGAIAGGLAGGAAGLVAGKAAFGGKETDKLLEPKTDETYDPHSYADSFKRIFAPASRTEGSLQTAGIVRAETGAAARAHEVAFERVRQFRKAVGKLSPADRYQFIDAIESGTPHLLPKDLQPAAKELRTMLDQARQEVQDLGTGKLQDFYINYFPHIWEKPDKAAQVIAQILGKRPLEGSKSFLRQRTIMTTREGLNRGLVPVTDNPLDLTLLKLREMRRYVMAHHIVDAMKEEGLVSGEYREGYVALNDKVFGRGAAQKYAPEPVARIINNYLSPGLRGNALYDSYRGIGNLMNQVQLGMSAFHAGFTALESVVSKNSLAIQQLAAHQPVAAAKSMLESTVAPVSTYLKGNRLYRAYQAPGSEGPEMEIMARRVAQAGGRVKMDDYMRTNATQALMKDLRTVRYGTGTTPGLELGARAKALGKTPFRAVAAAVEQSARPVLEHYVPRIKLGAFYDLAKFEMSRLPENASPDQVNQALDRAWNSVDNRMGQLVYDNLFWNKAGKDLAMASIRSVGWNTGTIREVGGGLLDLGKAVKGERLSPRAAYVMSLVSTVGLAGAITNYLYTGEAPKSLKDYFLPRTGVKDPEGNEERVQLPSYMKEILSYGKHPIGTLGHKLHPLLSTTAEWLQNEDYYGNEIRNPQDPFAEQAKQSGKFLAKQMLPFSVTNFLEQRRREQPMNVALPSAFGVTPANREDVRSPAQNLMQKLLGAGQPQGLTPEQVESSQARGDIAAALRKRLKTAPTLGDTAAMVVGQLRPEVESGRMTPDQALATARKAAVPSLIYRFRQLPAASAQRVYDLGSPEEQAIWKPYLDAKIRSVRPAGIDTLP